MSFGNSITLGSTAFVEITDGVYRAATSSADQPKDLIIRNTIVPDGTSQYLVEYRETKNSLTPGAKDDVLRVMIQYKYPPKSFTTAEVVAAQELLTVFLDATTIGRVVLGER